MSEPVRIKVDHAAKRREAYPSIADQLDAIWKGGADMEAMRQRILAIKRQIPKPTYKGQGNEG